MNLIDKHAPGWLDALFVDEGPLASAAALGTVHYALIDCAFAPQCHRLLKQYVRAELWRSLYENTPGATDEVLRHSPILLNVDAVDRPVLDRVLLPTNGLPMLGFIHSIESLDSLFERLSPWCVVNADGQHFVLRFPDTRRLPDVLNVLSPQQQLALCGPNTTWHFRGRDASWKTFDAPSQVASFTSQPELAPKLNGDQCAALIAGSEADEIVANLLYLSPKYAERHSPSTLHALATYSNAAANAMHLDTASQRISLCELFWRQPELSNNAHRDHEALRALIA